MKRGTKLSESEQLAKRARLRAIRSGEVPAVTASEPKAVPRRRKAAAKKTRHS